MIHYLDNITKHDPTIKILLDTPYERCLTTGIITIVSLF